MSYGRKRGHTFHVNGKVPKGQRARVGREAVRLYITRHNHLDPVLKRGDGVTVRGQCQLPFSKEGER